MACVVEWEYEPIVFVVVGGVVESCAVEEVGCRALVDEQFKAVAFVLSAECGFCFCFEISECRFVERNVAEVFVHADYDMTRTVVDCCTVDGNLANLHICRNHGISSRGYSVFYVLC